MLRRNVEINYLLENFGENFIVYYCTCKLSVVVVVVVVNVLFLIRMATLSI